MLLNASVPEAVESCLQQAFLSNSRSTAFLHQQYYLRCCPYEYLYQSSYPSTHRILRSTSYIAAQHRHTHSSSTAAQQHKGECCVWFVCCCIMVRNTAVVAVFAATLPLLDYSSKYIIRVHTAVLIYYTFELCFCPCTSLLHY